MAQAVDSNPCVGNNNTTKVTKPESDTFDFDAWLQTNNLSVLKPCFVEQHMTTLSSLKLDNVNFTQLVAAGIQSHPQLIPQLIAGIQSLKALQDRNESKLVFIEMTPREKAVFIKCQDFIDEVARIEDDFEQHIDGPFESMKKQHSDRLLLYKWTNDEKLDAMQSKMERTFKQLHRALDDQLKVLTAQIQQFKEHLKGDRAQYNALRDGLTSKLQDTHSLMDGDRTYYSEALLQCQGIISQHHGGRGDGMTFDFKHQNKEREAAIVRIGEDIQNRHDLNHSLMLQHKEALQRFVGTTIGDGKQQMDGFALTVHDEVRQRIECELKSLVTMTMKMHFMDHFTESVSNGNAPEIVPEAVDMDMGSLNRSRSSRGNESDDASTPPLPPPVSSILESDRKSIKSIKSEKSADDEAAEKVAAPKMVVNRPKVMDVRLLQNGDGANGHGLHQQTYSHSGTDCIVHTLSLSVVSICIHFW